MSIGVGGLPEGKGFVSTLEVMAEVGEDGQLTLKGEGFDLPTGSSQWPAYLLHDGAAYFHTNVSHMDDATVMGEYQRIGPGTTETVQAHALGMQSMINRAIEEFDASTQGDQP